MENTEWEAEQREEVMVAVLIKIGRWAVAYHFLINANKCEHTNDCSRRNSPRISLTIPRIYKWLDRWNELLAAAKRGRLCTQHTSGSRATAIF